MSINFDSNQIDTMEPLKNILTLRYVSGNANKIKSLKGL